MKVMEKCFIAIWVVLVAIPILYVLAENNRLGAEVIALQQSPDICWKCSNDIDAVAAEKEAVRIKEVHGE